MSWVKKIFNKIIDMTVAYNKYKTAALLSSHVKSRAEMEKILKDLYG